MKHALLFLMLLTSLVMPAQKKPDPDKLYCYKEVSVENDVYRIWILDIVARDGYSKFKVRFFNKTNDFLILKPSDMVFVINGQELQADERQIVLEPNGEGSRVVSVKGKGLQADSYVLKIKHVYRVPVSDKPLTAPDLTLPVANNSFNAGPFQCTVDKSKLSTDKSYVKLECVYNGDAIGILNPHNASAIMPNGQENADAEHEKGSLLEKGQKEKFTVAFREISGAGDMQKQTFRVKWNATFMEAKLMPLDGMNIDMVLDADKTKEKN